jgi:hypothetical protein
MPGVGHHGSRGMMAAAMVGVYVFLPSFDLANCLPHLLQREF